MFGWLRRTREAGTVGVALATIAAQRSCLINDDGWILDDCRRIDPSKATEEELEQAISSCQFYWKHAYPEYEDDLAMWIWGAASDELDGRRKAIGADW